MKKQGMTGVSSMHPIKSTSEQQFSYTNDVSPRQLIIKKDKTKEPTKVVEVAKSGDTGALATLPLATSYRENESEVDQFEVESEGMTRAKIDEIFD
jgi:hypothetical protein